jgi:C-terminal processing protease CtpA/Prc
VLIVEYAINTLYFTCIFSSAVKYITLERGNNGLGFSIIGGHGSPYGDLPIYVKTVFPQSSAAVNGGLKSGDQIVAVNGISLAGMSHAEAADILKRAEGRVELIVKS